MLRNNASKTLLLAACAVGAGIAFAPGASAEPPCQNSGTATVCETPGSASVQATPPANPNGPGPQTGSYGPSGDTPPVGN